MAVKIRLTRKGSKKKPFYRVVAATVSCPRDGKFLETLGTYDPMVEPVAITLKMDRIEDWMSKGAIPTQTVKDLMKKHNRTISA